MKKATKWLNVSMLVMVFLLAACSNDAPKNIATPISGGNNGMVDNSALDSLEESTGVNWVGKWKIESANENFNSIIEVTKQQGDVLQFSLNAFINHNPDAEETAPNIGTIDNGEAVITGDTAVFTNKDLNFEMTMVLIGDKLTVTSNSGEVGYFGAGVNVDGTYTR